MNRPRHDHTATLLSDGRVLVTGGLTDTGSLASTEIYDPAVGTWSLTGAMNTARYGHTATLLSDGRVLVTGGQSGSGNLASTEIYDPAVGTWSLSGPMNTARGGHTATLLSDGRVLVSGGGNSEIYDPAVGTWSLSGAMNTARGAHTATLLSDGRVLVTGGRSAVDSFASTEIYDPAVGTWSLSGAMSIGRHAHTATLLSDGRVLVTGGQTGSGILYLATTEIFDPAVGIGTWSLTGAMNTGRYGHRATLLSGGQVLVTGGCCPYLSSETYDPAGATWSPTTGPYNGAFHHTATLLSDGRVLVSGGYFFAPPWGIQLGLATAAVYTSDATPPEVSCGATDGSWHDSDVTVACTASDPESGLANPADTSFNLTTSVLAGTETAEGETDSRDVCNTVALCTTAGPVTGNKVDKKPPTITISSPTDATYQLNSTVSASYTCTDDGSSVASCQGPVANESPINTSSTGTKTFTVTTSDSVGNSSNLVVTYSVVAGGGGGQTSADLGITLSAPSRVASGGTLTYSIAVTNAGKATATGIVVSDTLPAGTAFASASSSQGTVTVPGSNRTVTVNVGSLANGATATVSIVVTVTAASGAILTDTASVIATTQDLNSKNNSATKSTRVSRN